MEQVDPGPTSRSREFWRGVLAEAPMMLGVVPFGLIFGVIANSVQLPAVPAQATSSMIFAGASQFIFARLYGEGAPVITIVLTAAIINLRHVLYSASVAPFLKSFSRGWKLLLSYLMADETYAIVIDHYNQLPRGLSMTKHFKPWCGFLGAGLTLWLTWQLSTGVGIFVGALIPESWALDFSLPLTFIAIVVPGLRDRAGWAAAVVAGVVSVVAFTLPFKLSLVAATVLGIMVALLVEARTSAPAQPAEAQS